ncbi:MAG: hypothetical protein ABIS07_13045 [Dokdonella sp.]
MISVRGRFLVLFALAQAFAAHAAIVWADLSLAQFQNAGTTFAQTIAIRTLNDGSDRVFIVERCSDIRIIKNGALLMTPFSLDRWELRW